MAERQESGEGDLIVARCYAGKRDGRPQKQRPRKGACTKKDIETFLSVLADTSNVMEACRAIGRATGIVYKWRIKDPAFRDAWERALEEGYAALEMELLWRARFGQDVTEYRTGEDGKEQPVKRVHSYCTRLALQILTQRQKMIADIRATRGINVPDGALALAEIKARLLTIKDRTQKGGAG